PLRRQRFQLGDNHAQLPGDRGHIATARQLQLRGEASADRLEGLAMSSGHVIDQTHGYSSPDEQQPPAQTNIVTTRQIALPAPSRSLVFGDVHTQRDWARGRGRCAAFEGYPPPLPTRRSAPVTSPASERRADLD